jgi:hypothetical protein
MPGVSERQPSTADAEPPREARLRLVGEPTSAALARRFVSGVLQRWRLPEMAGGDTELLTSELVGNAVAPRRLAVHGDRSL